MRMRNYLVLVAILAVAAVPALAGCEKESPADSKAAGEPGATPCPHAAKAAGEAGGKPCPHAAKEAGEAGGKPCPHAAKAAEAGAKHECGCPWAQQAKIAEALTAKDVKKVTLRGTVICGKCDLGKTEACTPMFKDEDGKLYSLFMNETAAKIKSAHSEGEDKKTVTVLGRLAMTGDTAWLGLDSFKL